MPDAATQVPSMKLQNLVDRTELREIRLQSFTGKILQTPPEELQVSFQPSEPEYSRENGGILVLFTHRLEYSTVVDSNDEPIRVGYIETVHIVELELESGEEPSDESISALIATNVLFMVFPYVRAALHRFPGEFGLPPILLPYLRRDTLGIVLPAVDNKVPGDADSDEPSS